MSQVELGCRSLCSPPPLSLSLSLHTHTQADRHTHPSQPFKKINVCLGTTPPQTKHHIILKREMHFNGAYLCNARLWSVSLNLFWIHSSGNALASSATVFDYRSCNSARDPSSAVHLRSGQVQCPHGDMAQNWALLSGPKRLAGNRTLWSASQETLLRTWLRHGHKRNERIQRKMFFHKKITSRVRSAHYKSVRRSWAKRVVLMYNPHHA